MNCMFKSVWTPECSQAFEQLKEKLTSAPIMGFADFTCPCIVETDASQYYGDTEQVIVYASLRLCPAEKNDSNYSCMNLELLALKWAITEKIRGYLLGSKFVVLTDNNPLCHHQTAKLGTIEQQ